MFENNETTKIFIRAAAERWHMLEELWGVDLPAGTVINANLDFHGLGGDKTDRAMTVREAMAMAERISLPHNVIGSQWYRVFTPYGVIYREDWARNMQRGSYYGFAPSKEFLAYAAEQEWAAYQDGKDEGPWGEFKFLPMDERRSKKDFHAIPEEIFEAFRALRKQEEELAGGMITKICAVIRRRNAREAFDFGGSIYWMRVDMPGERNGPRRVSGTGSEVRYDWPKAYRSGLLHAWMDYVSPEAVAFRKFAVGLAREMIKEMSRIQELMRRADKGALREETKRQMRIHGVLERDRDWILDYPSIEGMEDAMEAGLPAQWLEEYRAIAQEFAAEFAEAAKPRWFEIPRQKSS